tara:strand:- start:8 stop:868 length:861 start_codon:yes stop_codon:yes gene_type:complete
MAESKNADKILGAISGGLGLVSTGLGIFQALQGAGQQREAEKASAKFAADIRKRLLERTVGKQALPMRGFDLAKEGLAQRFATGVSALQSAGAEGVLGGLGGLMQQQTEAERALAAQVEKMEYARDLEYQRRLDRERDLKYQTLTELDLMGLKGAQAKAADAFAQKQQGIRSILPGLGMAAETFLKHSSLYPKTGGDTETQTPGFDPSVGMTNQGYSIGTEAPWGSSGSMAMGGASAGLTVPTTTVPPGMMPQGATYNIMDTPMGGELVPSALTTPYYWNPWNPDE